MEVFIDKSTFNRFDISTQIKFFNSELKKGNSISDICSILNISYNTIRDRFLRYNFTYNKFTRQYEKSNKKNFDEAELDVILEKLVTKVFENTSGPKNNLICKCEGNIINRSFRIYDKVLEDFIIFCENSNYSQYDILSQFIAEGINRYSK